MQLVNLAGSGKKTTQLGFGCAYLLGPGLRRNESLRLLDEVYDAGVRHFDVGPAYGHGATEAVLGEFLRRHGQDVTVTTKYGLLPMKPAERLFRALTSRVSVLRRLTSGPGLRRALYTASDARRSLENSLKVLGCDRIDLLLMHEPLPGSLIHDDLLEYLESCRHAGLIGDYGVGGEYSSMPELHRLRSKYCRVMQFNWSVLAAQPDFSGAYRIHYRAFAPAASMMAKRFTADPQMAKRWSEYVGIDLTGPGSLRPLLLRAALDRFPDSVVLFSAHTAGHVLENVHTAGNDSLKGPASRLQALIEREWHNPPIPGKTASAKNVS